MTEAAETTGGIYFKESHDTETFTTGCTLLDCALGGGWAVGRICNIVGDKSTGKTLAAIEACANYAAKYDVAPIYYAEAEAAFDVTYAESLGLPVARVNFVEDCFTVEALFDALTTVVADHDEALFVIDSLDALSDQAELDREMGAGTYGASKAKQLSQMFRRLVKKMGAKKVTVMVISQVRDNIGVTFGKKVTRSGGRALDFYASQVLWLSHIARIKKIRKGIERVVGVRVKGMVEKNKVGLPFREIEFPIYFSYGVEDVVAGLTWLIDNKQTSVYNLDESAAKKLLKRIEKVDDEEYFKHKEGVSAAVKKAWAQVEQSFAPRRRKY